MPERMKCPKCGAEVFASDDVCMDCGADLAVMRRQKKEEDAVPQVQAEPVRAPRERKDFRPSPSEDATRTALRWLWVPPLSSAARYPALRIYQYVCMIAAWGSLVAGLLTVGLLIFGWLQARSDLPTVPANLDVVALAVAVGLTLLWSVFWAFTLRAVVEGIQVYLDIEQNTRRLAEATEKSILDASA